ncbi:MAG: CHAT domain-containing protein [Bacteroidetes bacterium]|nr:CHAT domain-containing protein [Bacteroidota bacterium]MBU1720441.1 CHAT domain-containing protein [Bacteroidota bacterium]
MKSILLFFLLFFIPCFSYSQEKSVYEIYSEASELYANSEYQKAIDILEPALAEVLEQAETNEILLIQVYALQGLCYNYLTQYEKSVRQFEKALELTDKENLIQYYFRVTPSYVIALSRLGKVSKAIEAMNECIAIYAEKNGKESETYANMLNVAGMIYFETNDFTRSIALLEGAKNIYDNYLNSTSGNYNAILMNLATVYNKAGENDKADALFETNDNVILTNRKDSIDNLIKNLNYSSYLEDMGDYRRAYKLLMECKSMTEEIHGKKSYEYSLVLGNLGNLLVNKNNEAAEKFLIENVRLRAELYGVDHLMYATALNNLGNLYNYTERYSAAERLYLECLKIREEKLGKNNAMYANVVHNLAYLYAETGKNEKALQYYKESLAINENTLGRKHYEYRNNMINICNLYWKMNMPDSAEVFFRITDKLNTTDIYDNFSYLSEKQKEDYLGISSSFYKYFKAFAYERKTDNPSIVGDIYNDELMLKGIILSSGNAMRSAIEASENDQLKDLHKDLLSIKETLNKLYSVPVQERLQSTDSLEMLAVKKEKEMNKLMQENGLQKFLQNRVVWQDIQLKLQSDEVAIEFCNFIDINTDSIIYCALILRKNSKYPEMVRLFEEGQMRKILKRPENIEDDYYYIAPIYQTTPDKISKSDSLYELLWKPILPFLNGVKRIFLSPVGILQGVSFAAIPIDDEKIITDKYELIYLSNTKNILTVPGRSNISDVSVYGGIDYNSSIDSTMVTGDQKNSNIVSDEMTKTRNISWDYLSGSLIEADTISEMFRTKQFQVNLLTNENATEESFKKLNNNSPNVIHIATHGFFFPDNEIKKWKEEFGEISFITAENPLLRSGLMFAGGAGAWNGLEAKANSEDGVLTAYEISNLNLSNAKLVVLSACQTGLGEVAGNEGVYGLRRAFKMAGVDYMIMSLWSIPDIQTTELMTSFYIHLLASNDVPEAFHQAQQELRKKYSAFGWAAFVLIY